MLEVVGHPVAVNPDRELARIAREREWEVRQFRNGVPLRERVNMPPPGAPRPAWRAWRSSSRPAERAWWLWRRHVTAARARNPVSRPGRRSAPVRAAVGADRSVSGR